MASMRVLHLSWEYPPHIVGGLGRHVYDLAQAQSVRGDDVVVVAAAAPGVVEPPAGRLGLAPARGEVRLVRVEPGPPRLAFSTANLLAWVSGLEHAMIRAVIELGRDWRPDVVHCHDWMVAQAGATVRLALGPPLVATIHATEAGRAQGWVSSPLNTAIHAVEWWLANSADAVIACSGHMAEEINKLFGVAGPRVRVIPNGIDLAAWARSEDLARDARAEVVGSGGPLVVYTGRVEWEKGVQTLIAAAPQLRAAFPGIRLLVVGRGSHLPVLRNQVARMGLQDVVGFAGWVAEERMHALVAGADLAVVPSLYEPFGLVALEAAALGTPLVVANTGGLAEFAAAGACAGIFQPGDPQSLAAAAIAALSDESLRRGRLSAATAALAERHQWTELAQLTAGAYESAARNLAQRGTWLAPVPDFRAPMGNLLTGQAP